MALVPDLRPLVGRTEQLASLLELCGVPARTPGLVLLGGDAGVGKTRLLLELAARADAAGWRVLVGHCVDSGDSALPYLPFTEVFGALAARAPGLAESLVAAHPPVARLLPAHRLDSGGPTGGGERVDRVELVEAVHAALGYLSRSAPVLLVVEDAHWADRSTRDLLTLLFTRGFDVPVSVVVSYRVDDLHRRHPLRASVAEWTRLPTVTRVTLPPLPEPDIRSLVHVLHPAPMPEAQVRDIVERSEGNAFFTEELVATTGFGTGLPGDLADLLLVRLERLGDPARPVVRAAAVAGRRVPHDVLARVTGLDATVLDDAVRDAVEAHVLVSSPQGRYAFRHALMAEAVYDDLLPGERVRLHAAYARVLGSGEVPATAAELAHHARAAHDVPTALRASIRAGDEAMAVGGPDEAARHYELALELLEEADADDVDAVELTVRAAEAAAAAGHVFRAVALVQHALAELPEAAAGPARGSLLVCLAALCVLADTGLDIHDLTTEALTLVPDEATPLRGALLNLHARASFERGRFEQAARWADAAQSLGDALGLADVSSHAATTLGNLELRAGDPTSARHALELSLEQARASGDVGAELRTGYSLGSLLYETARHADARTVLERTWQRGVQSGRPWEPYAVEARCMLALIACTTGEWDRVAPLVDPTGQGAPPLAEALLAATSLAVPAAQGDPAVGAEVTRLREAWRMDGLVALRAGAAGIDAALTAGDLPGAVAVYDEVCAAIAALWRSRFMGRVRLAALVLSGVAREAGRAGSQQRPELVELGERLATDAHEVLAARGGRATVLGPEGVAWQGRVAAELLRLRWLAALDPPDERVLCEAWERNVAAFEAFGDVYETARSRTRWASVLRAAGRSAEAAVQAGLARDVARRLGAEPLLSELRTIAPRGADVSGAGSTPEPLALTPREQEVLRLVAQGRTNRQVAGQLFISDKTVSVHVSNILAKLGAGGRTEAVAIARRRGLLEDDRPTTTSSRSAAPS